jgi:uncharacterized membrane protein
MISAIRRYLISGILIWLPIWATFLVVRFLIDLMDNSLKLLPHQYQPDYILGFHLPGLGLIFTFLILFFTGMIVTNFFGRQLLKLWDWLINRIPLVRSIYSAVKQAAETLFSSSSEAFHKVLLVEYPRKEMWSVAFQVGECAQEIRDQVGQDMVTVFIPTTPNPTSGFLMMLSKQDVRELNMSVDTALKLIISLGVVQPTAIK